MSNLKIGIFRQAKVFGTIFFINLRSSMRVLWRLYLSITVARPLVIMFLIMARFLSPVDSFDVHRTSNMRILQFQLRRRYFEEHRLTMITTDDEHLQYKKEQLYGRCSGR